MTKRSINPQNFLQTLSLSLCLSPRELFLLLFELISNRTNETRKLKINVTKKGHMGRYVGIMHTYHYHNAVRNVRKTTQGASQTRLLIVPRPERNVDVLEAPSGRRVNSVWVAGRQAGSKGCKAALRCAALRCPVSRSVVIFEFSAPQGRRQ